MRNRVLFATRQVSFVHSVAGKWKILLLSRSAFEQVRGRYVKVCGWTQPPGTGMKNTRLLFAAYNSAEKTHPECKYTHLHSESQENSHRLPSSVFEEIIIWGME